MVKTRSSLCGGLHHTYDCVEVQGHSMSEVLAEMSQQANHVENDLLGCVISVDISEEYEPAHLILGRIWVADAASCEHDTRHAPIIL